MSEQLGESQQSTSVAKPERLFAEKQAKISIKRSSDISREFSQVAFRSQQEAQPHVASTIQQIGEELRKIPNFNQILMQASGTDVQLTNIQYDNDIPNQLTIHYNEDQPRIPLPELSSRRFFYTGVSAEPVLRDDDNVSIQCSLVGVDLASRHKWEVNHLYGVALSQFSAGSLLTVPLGNANAQIEIVELEQAERQIKAIEELAANSPHESGLVDDVHKIYRAFYSSSRENNRLSQLRNIRLLRTLGEKGMHYVGQDSKSADALNSAIATSIGRGRPLMVDGKLFMADGEGGMAQGRTAGYIGNVLDVVSTVPMSEEYIGPTLAMAPQDSDEQHSIGYIPLADIEKLHFGH